MLQASQLTSELRQRFPKAELLMQVARLDKPIGTFLLLWPTFWALWIANDGWPGWHLFLVFGFGTLLTRSAGCVINDVADRHFDDQVKRTANRPLATGRLPVFDALVFMGCLLFLALLLVLSTNLLTVLLALIGAIFAAIYPFMKRYTYLPQAILGIAFSFGIPMAFSASQQNIPQIAWLLFTANCIWTVAYDTQYAMVDRDDDIRLGLRSSAILFADLDKLAIGVLQLIFVGSLIMMARLESFGISFYAGLSIACALLIYQQYLIRNRERDECFKAFLNNHWVGFAIFVGIALDFSI